MPREHKPARQGQGLRIAIVVARFNELVTTRLLSGALDALAAHGVADEEIEVAWVPGSFEIPTAAMKMAHSGRYDAIVCLGAVIRGETAHFDHVSSAVTSGVARIGLETGIPTIFGVLTTDTIEQALARTGAKGSNHGYDYAVAAIEMANLLRDLG
ncbi:MAG: 6,7-dimethyl-8-ribityllumazine synthase [Chloroflexi bacterium]|nr:6,7-dimethyl-8-ribityllumazine synthase [Chloroflexota bacterium]